MSEAWTRLKQDFRFSPSEIRELAITVLIVSFIFAFDDGRSTFEMSHWIFNFFNTVLVVTLAFLFPISVQKAIGLWSGYRVEYHMWSYGLAFGVIVAIASSGHLTLLLPGGIIFFTMASQRLGRFRYGLNYRITGWVAVSGPIANIVLGMFVKEVMRQLGMSNPLLTQLIYVNFLLAFFTMLPIPPLPGLQFFFGTRMGYAFIFGTIMAYVALYIVHFYSLILAVILGAVCYAVYYFFFEKGAW